MRRLLFCLALITSLSLSAAAQSWKDTRLVVVPGESVGPIQLSQPVSRAVLVLLGEPTRRIEPDPDYEDSGLLVWTDVPERLDFSSGILVKLHDGEESHHVRSIFVSGVRAVTNRGAHLGMTLAQVREVYPEATFVPARGGGHWAIPGLNFTFSTSERLVEMVVLRGL